MSYAGEPAPEFEANPLTTLTLPRPTEAKAAPVWPAWASKEQAFAQIARQLEPMHVQLVELWPDDES